VTTQTGQRAGSPYARRAVEIYSLVTLHESIRKFAAGSLEIAVVGAPEARTCSGLPAGDPNKLGHPNPGHGKSQRPSLPSS